MADSSNTDPRSGFCTYNSTFYSKRKPIPLPANPSLDVTTFISSRSHHGHVAFIDAATGRRLSFSDLWRAVDAVASSLSSDFGVRKGHVVLLLSPNSIYFPIVCLAVMSLGAVVTTTNPLNTAREISKQISDSKPSLAFTVPPLLPKLADCRNLPIVLLGDGNPIPGANYKIVSTIEEMIKREPSQSRVRERVDQDDTATLLYSSGTTGASKGVASSHRNLIAMVQTVVNRFKLEEGKEIFICTVPMFHIYGLVAFATGLIASGSTVVILSKFEMDEMLMAIQKYSATYLPLVPPILVALVNHADGVEAEVRSEQPPRGALRRRAAEQGGDRGFRGEVPWRGGAAGVRTDGIDGDRGVDGLGGGEQEVRNGGDAVAEHGGEDCGAGEWEGVAGELHRRALAQGSLHYERYVWSIN